jgi:hypothetical protein
VCRPSANLAGGRYDPHEDPTTMKMTFIRATSAAACAVLLAACTTGNVLNIQNLNNPDVARAYSTPAGVESLIGGLYQQFNNGWNTTNTEPATQMMSFEGFATVANFCMNVRAAVPPNPIVNDRGNQCDAGNLADFSNFQKLARNSANLVQALDIITKAGGTTGSAAQDARDRGFAQFVNAISEGMTALVYDSGAVVDNTVNSNSIPPLSGYQKLMTAALAEIDSALATAGGAAAAAAFPLPSSWINGNGMTQAQFVQFAHSWKARLRAGVARTPAERAAVSWSSVIADATAGITADVGILMGGGWNCSYDCSQMYVSNGWHEMSLMILGMADTSGAYETFISAPLASRDGSQLVIHTPDLRLPQGATRAAQNADTPYNGSSFVPARYFNNRLSSDDFAGPGYGSSQYDHKRWLSLYKGNGVGTMVQFSKAENDMLAAEGYIYAGNFAAAQALIDASRAKHGLPSIGTITSATQQIQGGINGCVPQVPAPPAFNTAPCGSILEAMKWEKRMETAYVNAYSWWVEGRGWGDLVYGMPTMFPVPNEEMDSRQEPFYTLGGIGNPGSAGKGTYGF